ncbi:unnamed protein product [Protopolystoma xenopodis]|uniref:Uncharacterized protein n=1 Tax=Protopolystoma xenopodis TaxID=117903 RepID=A0A448XJZ1_9PLAT|nr:unnamed protein product [Protopolystoma xenopodis]
MDRKKEEGDDKVAEMTRIDKCNLGPAVSRDWSAGLGHRNRALRPNVPIIHSRCALFAQRDSNHDVTAYNLDTTPRVVNAAPSRLDSRWGC